ncbi:UPF0042 nucleotide-binding protein [Lipingzhangella halophila]|uniref:UPF0042 nucleotide-binding protein n=1 Tax=Lipingzhangella halophila TaxID=1783352 RepID=A0A7W7RID3_9ACTN|nr:RNase adapter RapZ [Lipingzhangella halophila]MBB4932452.1 UPF0042 nucleotide-binding protein [Lipingzhangella halophila]
MANNLDGELPPEIVVITGMSGAGRSTAARALEDLDWFVVDNLPPGLLPTMIDLAGRTHGAVPRVAAVVDVRSMAFTEDLLSTVEQLRKRGIMARVVFLEASDDALVRRFESVRRPHPLQGDGRLTDGISRERETLRAIRGEADLVIDTSQLNVHQLKAKVIGFFGETEEARPRANVVSFGYKHGLPVDADLVLDCRFLPNPHWVPELRPMSGRDAPVREYVLAQNGAKEMLDAYTEVLRLIIAGYQREGKHYMTLAVGCTGGKHRSVAMAERFGERLREQGLDVNVVHRDLGWE